MHVSHGIRITKNLKFHKTTINKLCMKTKQNNKKKITGYTYNKINTVAKISQKEIRFFKNVLHKESTVSEHLVFLLLLQHSGIDIHIQTVKLFKNICIFSKRHKCYPNTVQHNTPRTFPLKHSQ